MKDHFTDTVTVQPVNRPLRERDIQKRCVEYARANGWWARKFSSPAQRSVPDYLFAKGNVKLAVEFKAPGKVSTEAQRHEQELMRAAGWPVWEDIGTFGEASIEMFKAALGAQDSWSSRGR